CSSDLLITITTIFIAGLITSLFLKMLIAKDESQLLIMMRIGFSIRNLKIQYMIKMVFILGIGIVIGTIISNLIGEPVVSAILSFIGVSHMQFVIDPMKAYLLIPFLLGIVVFITTFFSITSLKKL